MINMTREILLSLFAATAAFAAPPSKGTALVTYNKDVLPILQNRCQSCHRPGEIGPMSFLSYKETRPWAKGIREAVASKKMPPWFADPRFGHFANDRSMSKQEIETLTAWADAGAPEGNAKDGPAPREFVDGWAMDKPDVIYQIPTGFEVPAKGTVEYQYIVVPTNLTEDKWVQIVEARPTNRAVVHHVVIYIREPNSKWLRGEAVPGVPFVPPAKTADGKPRNDIGGGGSDILTIYTPGNSPDVWRPGLAKLVKAGSDLVFQLHYTANGTAGVDQSRVGVIFAKEPPTERVMTLAVGNDKFAIPPGDPNYQVAGKAELPNGSALLSFFPHMHLRGKAFEYKITQPGGEPETLLKIDRYNFNWQLTYRLEKPLVLQDGAVVEVAGYFDNSANNPYNPDPKATVKFGEQSWEEMMLGFFDVAVDAKMDKRKFFSKKPAKADD
jgi:hypothetical protein